MSLKENLQEKIETCVVSEQDLGIRLDKLLTHHFSNHSRTYFQYLIDEGCVLINGKGIKKHHKLNLGDTIQVAFKLVPELDVQPESIPLDILYEDEWIIAINKPAGMVVHPAPGSSHSTFANALLYHCKQLKIEEFEYLRPGIVHRLDKDTTGILLGAKTQDAHQKLITLFATRQIEKEYLAICCGTPPEGEFSAPIKRHPVDRKKMAVNEAGKEAITHFKVLKKKGDLSLVSARLITGRTHQIRVHLKHLHTPVLGDPVYGNEYMNKKYGIQRQMLHAARIKMSHPISGEPLEIVAPPPHGMKNFIDKIVDRFIQ